MPGNKPYRNYFLRLTFNMKNLPLFLEHKAYNLRKWSIIQTSEAGSGHPTSCLSAADIVAVLFFYVMRYNPADYEQPTNDRFILSKGHAAPLLYAAWKEAGVLTENDLLTYRDIDSVLEGHPTRRFAYTEAATGSLGIGLSIAVGEALHNRLHGYHAKTYVLLGDSEMTEGSVWEAVQLAAFYKLHSLIAIIDCNRLGQSTQTIEGHDTQRYVGMLESFGWQTYIVDGHDIAALITVFDTIEKQSNDKPIMIVAKTYKGYGIAQVEDKLGYHGKPFPKKQLPHILQELKTRFLQAAEYAGQTWQAKLPQEQVHALRIMHEPSNALPIPSYESGTEIATRKAYADALTAFGDQLPSTVSLDAEVKNSTYAEEFEQSYPERFFQCFIAEQNMVGMGIGMARRGSIPFISTFGAFFTRAHDQIRMAAIGQAALRLVGSHAGVSIGEDGPSQMALEDIAMMRAIPNSIVLYPSDGISTWKLVEQMALYASGISYLRTTRAATPILYSPDATFTIGGCSVLRKDARDRVCVIGAGATLFEALAAYDALVLSDDHIFISVIDLYSIKPLDAHTLIKTARASGNTIITVEDHYLEGGLGQAVVYALRNTGITIECLAVDKLPRSGTPEKLRAYVGIDAQAIIKKVRELV